MKTSLMYGTIMAVAGALLTLAMYLTGFHDSPEKMQAGQWIGTVGGITIGVVCLALAMRERRAQRPPEQNWGYGSALGVGVLTTLVAALLGCVSGYLYFVAINPGFSEVILQLQIEKMEAAGLSAAQIERAEPLIRKWTSPGVMIVSQAFGGFLMGVVLSLIVAIFYRQRAATAEVPPPLAV